MLAIFAFFSVVSTVLVLCLAVALINVVIRRETASLMEDRIKMFVGNPGIQKDVLQAQNQIGRGLTDHGGIGVILVSLAG
jgi:hypothetical protein